MNYCFLKFKKRLLGCLFRKIDMFIVQPRELHHFNKYMNENHLNNWMALWRNIVRETPVQCSSTEPYKVGLGDSQPIFIK